MTKFTRRDLVTGAALALISEKVAVAGTIAGQMPWQPNAGQPPQAVREGPWEFFFFRRGCGGRGARRSHHPPGSADPGVGKDAGCAVFIDRQLAGPYGRAEGLYDRPPFIKGGDNQGPQSAKNPGELYRSALAALDRYCQGNGGKSWVNLPGERQDEILQGLESGKLALEGVDGKAFFTQCVKDMQEGFFADPLYGGNRNMCAWKMIGFPGARYDYRDWVGRHNERYPLPPVSIQGRDAWNPKR